MIKPFADFAGTVRRIVRCFFVRPCDKWPVGKPCPECGKHPHLRPWHDPVAIARGGTDTTRYRVECPFCGHLGPDKCKTPEQAITEWNHAANNSLTVSPDAKREANTSGGIGSV